MLIKSCYICGSKNFAVLYPSDCSPDDLRKEHIAARKGDITKTYAHNWVKCSRCGLVMANPVPNPEQLALLYANSDQSGYGLEEANVAFTYAKYLDRHRSLFVSKEKALDVGAGNGFFLRTLIDFGFESVLGIEPSESACQAAPRDIRPFIKNQSFVGNDFEPESFDLVTCFQTLEHVYYPDKMVESFSRILKKGGLFYGVSHNFQTLAVRLLGTRHPIVNAGHLTLFGTDTLRRLFARYFEVVDIFSVYNKYSFNYWASLLPLPIKLKASINRLLSKTGVGNFNAVLSLGNIGIFARKR